MLFCRSREGVRVELALRLAPGIYGYGPYDVFYTGSQTCDVFLIVALRVGSNDVFLHRFSRKKILLIDMSSVRWCGTADVASPRPREVGGACRRQVLAGARTQETVGGPNGAQRSEFRRTAPPDNNDIVLSQCFPAMS